MKRVVVALLLALAVPAFAAPKKVGVINPLPADGQAQGLAWSAPFETVKASVEKAGGTLVVWPTQGDYVQFRDNRQQTVYNLGVQSAMYSFRDGKLVGVTFLLNDSKTPIVLQNLYISAKAAYGPGQVLGQDDSQHAIAIGFQTPTGGFLVFAMAPDDVMKIQVVFVSASEAEHEAPAKKSQDKKVQPGTNPLEAIKL